MAIGLLANLAIPACADELTVSAAVSLKPALVPIAVDYERATGDHVTFNFGASGALLSQVKAGAPVDVFISAADKQVDELTKAGLADPATRAIVARNRLVLIAPADSGKEISSLADLRGPAVKRLAIGQPKTVPAGDYASQALAKAGLTDAVTDKLITGANVRQVLDYVVRGEVDAGLVYATDTREAGKAVRMIEMIDASFHDPIVYPGVVVKGTAKPQAAARFLKHLTSDAGQHVFAEKGFEPAPGTPPTSSAPSEPARLPPSTTVPAP